MAGVLECGATTQSRVLLRRRKQIVLAQSPSQCEVEAGQMSALLHSSLSQSNPHVHEVATHPMPLVVCVDPSTLTLTFLGFVVVP